MRDILEPSTPIGFGSVDGLSALVPEELAGFLVISPSDGSVLFEGWASYLCG